MSERAGTVTPPDAAPAVRLRAVGLRYREVIALDAITLDLPAGRMIGVVMVQDQR